MAWSASSSNSSQFLSPCRGIETNSLTLYSGATVNHVSSVFVVISTLSSSKNTHILLLFEEDPLMVFGCTRYYVG